MAHEKNPAMPHQDRPPSSPGSRSPPLPRCWRRPNAPAAPGRRWNRPRRATDGAHPGSRTWLWIGFVGKIWATTGFLTIKLRMFDPGKTTMTRKKITMFNMVNQLDVPFSMAMLNYQRVMGIPWIGFVGEVWATTGFLTMKTAMAGYGNEIPGKI